MAWEKPFFPLLLATFGDVPDSSEEPLAEAKPTRCWKNVANQQKDKSCLWLRDSTASLPDGFWV